MKDVQVLYLTCHKEVNGLSLDPAFVFNLHHTGHILAIVVRLLAIKLDFLLLTYSILEVNSANAEK